MSQFKEMLELKIEETKALIKYARDHYPQDSFIHDCLRELQLDLEGAQVNMEAIEEFFLENKVEQ